MGKILEVKDLVVSFRTNNGKLQAVRDISFDINEGETLAIVGESGSGKSVTAKSILGLNAANTIHEGGEIIYKGEDLLKYSEKDFNKIRGNEITMIFQDPLSSLDPVMKIGKQMTEATLLNSKTRSKEAKKEIKDLTALLKKQGCTSTSDVNQIAAALEKSAKVSADKEKESLSILEKYLPLFEKDTLDEKEATAASKEMIKAVKAAIDPLTLSKNSRVHTFHTTMEVGIQRYFMGIKKNPKELKRVEKETEQKKQGKRKKKGNVIPADLTDVDYVKSTMVKAIKEVTEAFEEDMSAGRDYSAEAKTFVEYLQKRQKDAETVVTKKEAYDRAISIMSDVGIKEPEKRFNQYPHEFSGGMRQRIVIAIAIAANPELLLCDEPTTALDVTIQAQILELINEIKRKKNLSVLFITHDLGVVANMADRVAVMYAGKIVEYGTVNEIFYDPKHPYTWALLSSMPSLDSKDKLDSIPGTPPNMIYPPVGDAFADRNKYAMQIDYEQQPPFFKVSDTHYAATWLLHPDAPKVEMPEVIRNRIQLQKERRENAVKEDADDE